MKAFLQNLLIFFALVLCALITFQWVRETKLHKKLQEDANTIHQKAETIQNLEQTVKRDEADNRRLEGIKNQLNETVQSNTVQIAQLSRDLRKVEAENERNAAQLEAHKDALKVANERVLQEGEDIKILNAKVKELMLEQHDLVTNLNGMTAMINSMATDWSRRNDEMQKMKASDQREAAVTNIIAMAKDFNGFTVRWNQMKQQMAAPRTNAAASNP